MTLDLLKIYPPDAWDEYMAGRDRQLFYDRMTADLPVDTEIVLDFESARKFRIEYRHPKFSFTRAVDDDEVYNSGGDVRTEFQGQGIARIANRNMMDFYHDIGINRIYMTASEIGLYAWARTGFVPKQPDWATICHDVGLRLDYMEKNPDHDKGPLEPKYLSFMRGILDPEKPKNMWMVVDQTMEYYGVPMGKLLTLQWERKSLKMEFRKVLTADMDLRRGFYCYDAVLDLTDADSMHRFNAYSRPQKPQPLPKNGMTP